jgi:hypothetical protein
VSEIRFFDGLNSETIGILIFKIVDLLIGLGSLMICTHNLITLTKTKEIILYCESFRYGGNSQHLRGPALSCLLMTLADQYFRTHCMSYKLSTNTKLHKQQRKHSQP